MQSSLKMSSRNVPLQPAEWLLETLASCRFHSNSTAAGVPRLYDHLSQHFAGVQAFTPQAVFLQGRQCDLTLTVNVTNETPVIPVDTSQLIESSPQPVSIDGINILGVDGEILTLKGANWFGFEQPVSFADSLQPALVHIQPSHTLLNFCFSACAVATQQY